MTATPLKYQHKKRKRERKKERKKSQILFVSTNVVNESLMKSTCRNKTVLFVKI